MESYAYKIRRAWQSVVCDKTNIEYLLALAVQTQILRRNSYLIKGNVIFWNDFENKMQGNCFEFSPSRNSSKLDYSGPKSVAKVRAAHALTFFQNTVNRMTLVLRLIIVHVLSLLKKICWKLLNPCFDL